MAWWILPAAAKGLATVYDYAKRRKNRIPAFESTDYGKYLKDVSEKGSIPPEQKMTLMRRATTEAGVQAQRRKAYIKGRLIKSGMEGSVAGVAELAKPDIETQRLAQTTSENIDLANVDTKRQAAREFAVQKYQNSVARSEQNRQDTGALVSGLAETVGTGVQGYLQDRAYKSAEESRTALEKYRQTMAEAAAARAKAGSDTSVPDASAPDSDWLMWGKKMGYKPDETLIFRDDYLMELLKKNSIKRIRSSGINPKTFGGANSQFSTLGR